MAREQQPAETAVSDMSKASVYGDDGGQKRGVKDEPGLLALWP